MAMQRPLLLFKESCKSQHTFNTYYYWLKRFTDYYKLRSIESIIEIEKSKIQEMVEDFVMSLKANGNKKSTINPFVNGLMGFLEVNDIELRWKKIKKLLPPDVKTGGRHAYKTEHIKKMLDVASGNKRNKAFIHFMASTGVRIGALPELKIKHIKNMDYDCKCVTIYENSKEEYFVFLTPEASLVLDEYFEQRKHDGEHLHENSFVFRESYKIGITKAKPLAVGGFRAIMYRVLKCSGMRPKSESSLTAEELRAKRARRHDISVDHGFRKRFNTILKTTDRININIAERLMGHSITIPLDNAYLDAEIDVLFTEFKKAISNLTISEEERQKIKLEQKERDLSKCKNEQLQEIQKLREERLQDKREMLKLLNEIIRNPEKIKEIKV